MTALRKAALAYRAAWKRMDYPASHVAIAEFRRAALAAERMRWYHLGSRGFYRFGVCFYATCMISALSRREWFDAAILSAFCLYLWDKSEEAPTQ